MISDKVIAVEKISFKDAVEIAKKGTHCGMCRFDFLGSGVCPAGRKKGCVFPAGGRLAFHGRQGSGRVLYRAAAAKRETGKTKAQRIPGNREGAPCRQLYHGSGPQSTEGKRGQAGFMEEG